MAEAKIAAHARGSEGGARPPLCGNEIVEHGDAPWLERGEEDANDALDKVGANRTVNLPFGGIRLSDFW